MPFEFFKLSLSLFAHRNVEDETVDKDKMLLQKEAEVSGFISTDKCAEIKRGKINHYLYSLQNIDYYIVLCLLSVNNQLNNIQLFGIHWFIIYRRFAGSLCTQ